MVKNILLKSFVFLFGLFLAVNSASAFYTTPPVETLLDIPLGHMVGDVYYSSTSVTTFEYPALDLGVFYDGGEVVDYSGAGFSLIPEKTGYYNFLIKTRDSHSSTYNTSLRVQPFSNSVNREGLVDFYSPSITNPLQYTPAVGDPVDTSADTSTSYLSLYSVYLEAGVVYRISTAKGSYVSTTNAFQIVVRPAEALGRYVVSTGILKFGADYDDYRLYPLLDFYMPQDMKPFVFYSDFAVKSSNFASLWNDTYINANTLPDAVFVSSPTTDGKNLNLIGPLPVEFPPVETLYFSFFFPNASSTPPAFTDDGLNYQIQYKDCGVDNVGGCFYNAFVDIFSGLFIPKIWDYRQILDDSGLMQKIPFSIYSKIVDFKEDLKSLDDETRPYTPIDFMGVYELKPICELEYLPSWFCSSLKAVFSFMLYAILATYLWRKIRYFF